MKMLDYWVDEQGFIGFAKHYRVGSILCAQLDATGTFNVSNALPATRGNGSTSELPQYLADV
jgi:hypothetical protein